METKPLKPVKSCLSVCVSVRVSVYVCMSICVLDSTAIVESYAATALCYVNKPHTWQPRITAHGLLVVKTHYLKSISWVVYLTKSHCLLYNFPSLLQQILINTDVLCCVGFGYYTAFHKQETGTKFSLFWQPQIQTIQKSLKAPENYCWLWLWNKCCLFLNFSLSISLIRKIFNTSNEQAELTRHIPMKIALNLPKSLFTQKLLVIRHNAFCRMFYSECLKWQPHKSNATVWLHCLSHAGPGITIPQW